MQKIQKIRILGYGSLLNPEEVGRRIDEKIAGYVDLAGYTRTFRKLGRTHLYLTLKPSESNGLIRGSLIDVTPAGLVKLAQREFGYELVEVTSKIKDYPAGDPPVWCFIAPPSEEISEQLLKIRKDYLECCLEGIPPEERKRWLEQSEIPPGVQITDD